MGTERDRASLERAYGSTGDVPALLRALESTDEAVRERAMDRLHSSLCFREEVPTAPAVPQLIRLALHGAGPRAELLGLLADLANWAGHRDERQRARRAVAEAMPSLTPFAHAYTTRRDDRRGHGGLAPAAGSPRFHAGRQFP
ncbi:hypothetical protein AB0L81_32785, partial [Streptomyces sp. NPDC052127]